MNSKLYMRKGPAKAGDEAIYAEQFERDVYKLAILKGLIQPKTILDVGAHIGCFSLRALECWPEAQVQAFEPNQESVGLYRKNLGQKASITAAAISYSPERCHLAENLEWAGGGVLVAPNEKPDAMPGRKYVEQKYAVPTHTLEDLDSACYIDLLKLDCEGSEIETLKRMSDGTANRIGFIVGEYHVKQGGFCEWEGIVKSRFPKWGVLPLDRPSNYIGNFAAGPAEIIQKLHERLLAGAGPVPPFRTVHGNWIILDFFDGAKVTIYGEHLARYKVSFSDSDTGENIYTAEIEPGAYAEANPRYFIPWHIKVEEIVSGKVVETFEHRMNLRGKDIWIGFSSRALGDTLAWIPYVEEFLKKHDCRVYCETHHNGILCDAYPDLEFVEVGQFRGDVYAGYRIGTFDNNYSRNKNNWRLIPLQQVASDVLGLEHREIRPIVKDVTALESTVPYVAISEFTAPMKAKEWNRPGAWQEVVDHCRSLGYAVTSVSKENTNLSNVSKRNGSTIEETMSAIKGASLYAGMGSGLAWLAWALKTPVVLIAGMSDPFCEFKPAARIHNPNVCHGCFNDPSHLFDRGNYRWCPRNKDFECTREIRSEMVIREIDRLLPKREMRSYNIPAPMPVVFPERERILYIAPHLSTGGLPQYMLSSIRDTISAGAEVMAVEWEFLSEKYVVQRRKIADLCKLVSMGGIQDKVSKLKDIIAEFRPDIVYVQESPEVCCLRECADLLYSRNGEYQIRETSHCSRLVPSLKKWFPDEYLWVSEHHQRLFADGGTPSSVVEYRPMRRSRPDRVTALRCLGLDPWKTHVLNVGLFTPGKNQGEAFDVARFLPGVLFHFVGNRAENFRGYWEPIIASKPANCVLWDESDDVDKFYSSMDMLLFTSTSELNPLVPIEALSWGMPVLMRNLPVYHGKYDENPLVTYISGDVGETVGILRRRLLPMAA